VLVSELKGLCLNVELLGGTPRSNAEEGDENKPEASVELPSNKTAVPDLTDEYKAMTEAERPVVEEFGGTSEKVDI
jgi:hypothetical protein